MQTDQALPFYFCHFFPFQRCVWPLIVLLLFKFRFSVLLELRKCNGEQEYYTDQLIESFEIKTNLFYMVFTKLAPVNYPSTRSHTKNYKGNLYKTHCSKIKKGSETLSRFRISLLPTSQWIKFSIYSLGFPFGLDPPAAPPPRSTGTWRSQSWPTAGVPGDDRDNNGDLRL